MGRGTRGPGSQVSRDRWSPQARDWTLEGPVELQARPGPGEPPLTRKGLGATGGAASPAEPRNRRGDSIRKVRKVSIGSAGN